MSLEPWCGPPWSSGAFRVVAAKGSPSHPSAGKPCLHTPYPWLLLIPQQWSSDRLRLQIRALDPGLTVDVGLQAGIALLVQNPPLFTGGLIITPQWRQEKSHSVACSFLFPQSHSMGRELSVPQNFIVSQGAKFWGKPVLWCADVFFLFVQEGPFWATQVLQCSNKVKLEKNPYITLNNWAVFLALILWSVSHIYMCVCGSFPCSPETLLPYSGLLPREEAHGHLVN